MKISNLLVTSSIVFHYLSPSLNLPLKFFTIVNLITLSSRYLVASVGLFFAYATITKLISILFLVCSLVIVPLIIDIDVSIFQLVEFIFLVMSCLMNKIFLLRLSQLPNSLSHHPQHPSLCPFGTHISFVLQLSLNSLHHHTINPRPTGFLVFLYIIIHPTLYHPLVPLSPHQL
jgi:hypothetical protein